MTKEENILLTTENPQIIPSTTEIFAKHPFDYGKSAKKIKKHDFYENGLSLRVENGQNIRSSTEMGSKTSFRLRKWASKHPFDYGFMKTAQFAKFKFLVV